MIRRIGLAAAAALAMAAWAQGCGGGSIEADLNVVCDLAERVCPETGCAGHAASVKAFRAGLKAARPTSSLGREVFIALESADPERVLETAARAADYEGIVWSCPPLGRLQEAAAIAAHGFGPVLEEVKEQLAIDDTEAMVDELTRYVSNNEARFGEVSKAWGRDAGNRSDDVAAATKVGEALVLRCELLGLERCGVIAQALTTLLSRCSPEGEAGHPVFMVNSGKRPLLVPEVDKLLMGDKDPAAYTLGLDEDRAAHLMAVTKALFWPLLKP